MPNLNAPQVSIILLNYNSYEDTIECFESLQGITYKNYNIIIVDNNSPDNSMERMRNYMLRESFDFSYFECLDYGESKNRISQVTLIQSGHNGGYGFGNNLGIKYALRHQTDYVLILNNDTIVTPSFIEPLVETCEQDGKVGIAGGKILYHDDPEKIWFNGGVFHSKTSRVSHEYFNTIDTGQPPPKNNTFISGCLWLIPSGVFEKVGLINEDYFMYLEDLEFCQRTLVKGYKLKVNDKSIIYHKAGNSSGGHWSEFTIYWMGRNGYKFIRTNVHGLHKYMSFFALLFLRPIKWVRKMKFNLVVKHYKGIFDGFRS